MKVKDIMTKDVKYCASQLKAGAIVTKTVLICGPDDDVPDVLRVICAHPRSPVMQVAAA